MTVSDIRKQVESAKAEAARNFDANHGEGAYFRLSKYSASDANRRALDHIANVAKEDSEKSA